jgi:hypothetical protein
VEARGNCWCICGRWSAVGHWASALRWTEWVLAWTEPAQVDRSEPYAVTVLAVPERSAAPVDRQSTVTTPLVEPTGSSVYTSLEAPAYS